MFGKLFSKSKKESVKKEQKGPKINWIPLTSVEQIEKIKEESKSGYVGVFKHSTRCSISTNVLKRFDGNFPEDTAITMYYIDLLNYREVSSEIGFTFQVVHQSPQFLLIKNEKAVKHASHYDILGINFEEI